MDILMDNADITTKDDTTIPKQKKYMKKADIINALSDPNNFTIIEKESIWDDTKEICDDTKEICDDTKEINKVLKSNEDVIKYINDTKDKIPDIDELMIVNDKYVFLRDQELTQEIRDLYPGYEFVRRQDVIDKIIFNKQIIRNDKESDRYTSYKDARAYNDIVYGQQSTNTEGQIGEYKLQTEPTISRYARACTGNRSRNKSLYKHLNGPAKEFMINFLHGDIDMCAVIMSDSNTKQMNEIKNLLPICAVSACEHMGSHILEGMLNIAMCFDVQLTKSTLLSVAAHHDNMDVMMWIAENM